MKRLLDNMTSAMNAPDTGASTRRRFLTRGLAAIGAAGATVVGTKSASAATCADIYGSGWYSCGYCTGCGSNGPSDYNCAYNCCCKRRTSTTVYTAGCRYAGYYC